ncbi:unnamed protein product, partial [Amoebophrya sp. A25]
EFLSRNYSIKSLFASGSPANGESLTLFTHTAPGESLTLLFPRVKKIKYPSTVEIRSYPQHTNRIYHNS